MKNATLIKNAKLATDTTLKADCGILIAHDGHIADVFEMSDFDAQRHEADEIFDAKGLTVTPGLVDTHIHGIGGFGTDDGKAESILGMSETLAKFGVTSFLPTLYAGRPEKMEKEALAVLEAMGKEQGARILGVNFEGPFLSPLRAGAQDPASISEPSAEIFQYFIEICKGHLICMTVAPELSNIEKIAAIAQRENIVLLAGHTNATYAQAEKGVDLGIKHATHMFNAMPSIGHKELNISGAALIDDRFSCEIISDGVHVHKDLVKFVATTKPAGKVVLITDSLAPTSLGKGTFIANGTKVILGERGAFVNAENPELLCGSALTLNRAVANLSSWGIAKENAVDMATKNPATIYGFKDIGTIKKGHLADISVFDEDFNAVAVFIAGKRRK